MRSLDLSCNALGPRAMRALVATEALRNLAALDLSNNRLYLEGAKILARATHLTQLSLHGSGIGPEGARLIARSQTIPPTVRDAYRRDARQYYTTTWE